LKKPPMACIGPVMRLRRYPPTPVEVVTGHPSRCICAGQRAGLAGRSARTLPDVDE
jgi:hypothetical protein